MRVRVNKDIHPVSLNDPIELPALLGDTPSGNMVLIRAGHPVIWRGQSLRCDA